MSSSFRMVKNCFDSLFWLLLGLLTTFLGFLLFELILLITAFAVFYDWIFSLVHPLLGSFPALVLSLVVSVILGLTLVAQSRLSDFWLGASVALVLVIAILGNYTIATGSGYDYRSIVLTIVAAALLITGCGFVSSLFKFHAVILTSPMIGVYECLYAAGAFQPEGQVGTPWTVKHGAVIAIAAILIYIAAVVVQYYSLRPRNYAEYREM